MKTPWFGAKAYGIGLSPKSPAGWLSVLVYLGLVRVSVVMGHHFNAGPWVVGAAVAVLTVGLFALMVVKGDGQGWRWRSGGR